MAEKINQIFYLCKYVDIERIKFMAKQYPLSNSNNARPLYTLQVCRHSRNLFRS